MKQAIRFIIKNACAGLFLDPGLGKTSIMYAAFKLLRAAYKIPIKMLVIAPLNPARSTWPNEQQKWSNFADIKVVVLHGPAKAALLQSDADVYVINPEGLGWLFESMKGADWWWDILCVDESTRFKHTDTTRFKTLKPRLEKFGRRYILTGSPAPNGLLDLFGQVFILDLGHALGRFITKYRSTYFDPTGFGGYTWVPREDTPQKIYAKLKPLVLRMSAKDLLELPELIFNRVEVELPPTARKQYDAMEELLLMELEEGVITAANAAVASGKCRQIANGGIYVDKEGVREAVHLHEAKIDAVAELVESMQGTPTLVAYEFDHDRARLQKRFPGVPYLGGGVTSKEFKRVEAAWNAGDIPVLLAQPQSVAHGLNLQGTHASIISHSLTWNLEDDEQLIRRIWRQGQKERVVVHRVVAKDTIDEAILQMLRRKDKTQTALLDALKTHLRRR
jgi:SNF2 family DNA or RNA helicase